jgi:trans-aconitate methyltransferase
MRNFLTFFLSMSAAISSLAHQWDAKAYNANSASQQTAAERLISSYELNPRASLLDVGCGDGKITLSLAQKLSADVVGLDVSPSMIEYARENFVHQDPNLQFVVGDAAKLDYHNQFDYVTSFTALQWVTNQSAAIKGMFDALKPGGNLLVTMPRHYPECLSNAILELAFKAPYNERFAGFELNQVFFGVDEYKRMLSDAGFTNIAVSYVTSHDRFPSLAAFTNFLKQWLPWAQVFTDPMEKDTFMKHLMERYVAYCPVSEDGSVEFLKLQLEATAVKPKESTQSVMSAKTDNL